MSQEQLPSSLYTIAEVELVYKSHVKAAERPQIKCSQEAYNILRANWNDNKIELLEEFKVLFLNRANKVKGIYNASSGGITGSIADPRLIFAAALKANAVSIIVAHNHPSGNLTPSLADQDLTERMGHAGKFLQIPLQDHLIINSEGYFSFADAGMMPW